MSFWTVIVAAGQSRRMTTTSQKVVMKQFFQRNNAPLYWSSALAFFQCTYVDGIIFVFPSEYVERECKKIESLVLQYKIQIPYKVVAGGELRQNSVKNGLSALPQTCTKVLIHDGARPFIDSATILRVVEALSDDIGGVVPVIPVIDTVKHVTNGYVQNTISRESLKIIQTPQAFHVPILLDGHEKAEKNHWVVTDDASIIEKCGKVIRTVEGSILNKKITYLEDVTKMEHVQSVMPLVGYGYDVHKYVTTKESVKHERAMKLGGVLIPNAPKIIAHSDGDVLLHALMDALLGCIAAGDIGVHFPDTDAKYKGIDSAELLNIVLQMVKDAQVNIMHVDLTVIAQIPRISPYREQIKENIVNLLGLNANSINVKATTEEGLGFTGENKGIKAVAVVTALRIGTL